MRTMSYALPLITPPTGTTLEIFCLAVRCSAMHIQGEPAMRIVLFDLLLKA